MGFEGLKASSAQAVEQMRQQPIQIIQGSHPVGMERISLEMILLGPVGTQVLVMVLGPMMALVIILGPVGIRVRGRQRRVMQKDLADRMVQEMVGTQAKVVLAILERGLVETRVLMMVLALAVTREMTTGLVLAA